MIVCIAFGVIAKGIQHSVSEAQSKCEQMRQTKALNMSLAISNHDEISDTMKTVNVLLQEIAQAMSEAKSNAAEQMPSPDARFAAAACRGDVRGRGN